MDNGERSQKTPSEDLRGSASLQLTLKRSETSCRQGHQIPKSQLTATGGRDSGGTGKGNQRTKLVSPCVSAGPPDLDHVENFPQVLNVWAQSSGSTSAESVFHLRDEELLELWKRALKDNLAKVEERPTIVRENWEFKSPLDADLWEQCREEFHAPDGCIPDFMRRGAPMGMECPIPPIPRFGAFFQPPKLQNPQGPQPHFTEFEKQKQNESKFQEAFFKEFQSKRRLEKETRLFGRSLKEEVQNTPEEGQARQPCGK